MHGQEYVCHSHTDIDYYASSVLGYTNTNISSVFTLKRITVFSGLPTAEGMQHYQVIFRPDSSSRANIKRAKHSHKLRIEEDFSHHSALSWSWLISQPAYHPHWTPANLPSARTGIWGTPSKQHYTPPLPTWTTATPTHSHLYKQDTS